MKNVPKTMRIVFASCAVGALVVVISHAASRDEIGVPGGRLSVAQRAEAKTLNPLLAVEQPSREVISLLMADLVHINRETQQTEPALAESWRASSDGRRYTVELRKGLRFS